MNELHTHQRLCQSILEKYTHTQRKWDVIPVFDNVFGGHTFRFCYPNQEHPMLMYKVGTALFSSQLNEITVMIFEHIGKDNWVTCHTESISSLQIWKYARLTI